MFALIMPVNVQQSPNLAHSKIPLIREFSEAVCRNFPLATGFDVCL